MILRFSGWRSIALAPVLVLAALGLVPALAQATEDPAAVVSGGSAAQPPPTVVSVPDIPLRADETMLDLREIESRLQADPEVSRIDRELDAAEMLDSLPRPWEDEGFPLSLRTLTDIRREWLRAQGRVGEWQQILQTRAQAISDQQRRLRAIRDLWRETGEEAEKQEPEYYVTVEARIVSVLEATAGLRAVARERLDPVLALQERLSLAAIAVDEGIAKLDEHMAHARERMFLPDRAPLWTLRAWKPDEKGLTGQIRESWGQVRSTLADYWEDYRSHLMAQLGLLAVTLALFLWMAWRGRRWKHDEPELQPAVHILGRPLSTAILLTLLLGIGFYPNPPRSLLHLMSAALLVPVIRLLPGLLPAASRNAIYVVTGLFVVERIEEMTVDGSVLSRLLLLGLTIVTFALATWVTQLKKSLGIQRRWWKGVRLLGRLSPLILGISLVANVVGIVNLSDLLTSGMLRGAFLALVLLAADKVVDALLLAVLRSAAARSLRSVRTHPELLHRRVMAFVQVAIFLFWLVGTLTIFTVYDPVVTTIWTVLDAPLTVGALSISLGDILAFVVAVWLARKISQFLRFVLEEDIYPKTSVPRGTQSAFSSLIHYTLMTLGLVIGLAASGIELTRITVLLGALGVGIGFGLQSVVNNFISGLILIFERPVQVGDTVEFGEVLGRVRRIGIRSSTVRTYRGAEVIVPNADLVSNAVINWTLSDQLRRIDVEVGVKYGTDPERVIEVLLEAVKAVDRVRPEPEPQVLFMGFGDSSLDFLVRGWITSYDEGVRMKSAIALAVNAALKGAGMEIPFPQRDLHLRSMDGRAAGSLRGEETPG